jgi:hypothetical protein
VPVGPFQPSPLVVRSASISPDDTWWAESPWPKKPFE